MVAMMRTMKIAQAATPIRVGAHKQMTSVPNHNYQVKIRKNFRILAITAASSATQTVTISTVLNAVRNELGYPSGPPVLNTGEQLAMHDIKVYSTSYNPGSVLAADVTNTLIVSLFDIEESVTSGFNRTALFEDVSSAAGVNFIRALYPIQNRPTFNAGTTPSLGLLEYQVQSGNLIIIDSDITYVRTPSTTN